MEAMGRIGKSYPRRYLAQPEVAPASSLPRRFPGAAWVSAFVSLLFSHGHRNRKLSA
jgi:hypothetical protein